MAGTKKTIAILGAGAVGNFLAVKLWQCGNEVVLITSKEKAEIFNSRGILFKSEVFGNIEASPRAVSELDFIPDVLFVTTKAPGIKKVIKRVPTSKIGTNTVVIPLLNGMEHIEDLRFRFGKRVAVGTISIEVFMESKNFVKHTTPFVKIEIASRINYINKEDLEEMAIFLTGCGIKTKVGKNEAQTIWNKLARLNALSLTTSVTDKPVGVLREDYYWRVKIEDCIKEAARVAERDGAIIKLENEMQFIDNLDPRQLTSMQRDISAGKESELDAIAGSILRSAEKQGLDCPTIQELVEKIQSKTFV